MIQQTGKMAIVALALSFGLMVPATAQNFADIDNLISFWLRSHTINDISPSQASVKANLESRRVQLDAQISAGVAAGQLSTAETARLRAELDSLSASINTSTASGGGLTIGEVRDALTKIRMLATNIQRDIRNNDTTVATDINVKLSELRARINTAVNAGQLRSRDANQLRSSLNWINAQHSRFARNGLTAAERAQLDSFVSTVGARFESMVGVASVPDATIRNKLNDLRARVNAANSARTITRAEFNQLTSSLNWINSQHNLLIAGGLTTDERTRLESYLTTTEARFGTMSTVAAEFDLSGEIAQSRANINRARANGRISVTEANKLLRDLDYVTRSQRHMMASGNRMTREEFTYLRRLLSNVDKGLKIFM